jgi:NhaP-type Na+/H+ or K+/H+ antiporter
MSNLSEGFVFTYLGLSFFNMSKGNYSLVFIIVEFNLILFSRFITIYILSFIINLFSDYPLNYNEQKIISFSGSIRGAIAFGLALSIQTGNLMKDSIILSSTLILVFTSTIIFGAMIPSLTKNLNYIHSNDNQLNYKLLSDEKNLNNNNIKDVYYEEDEDEDNLSGFKKIWLHFDNLVLKNILVGNWEKVKKKHNEFTKKINDIINN